MPRFDWRGKTPDGHSVSGTIESTSKEAAVSALRAKTIAVSALLERADGLHVQWGRIFLGLLLLAGAAYDCTVMTTMAGFHTLESAAIPGTNLVSVDHRAAVGGKRGRAAASRLTISAASGRSFSTEWLQTAMPGSDRVAEELNQAFAQQKATVSAWQVEIAPMIVAAVLAIIGLLVLVRAVSAG